jgi:hypothetical protein
MQPRDDLHLIFKRRLDQIDPDKENVQDLVFEVVAEFISMLMSQGNIPHYLLDQLENDLREEVYEIYRKTTYGFLSLKEFKNSGKSQRRRFKARTS